MSERKIIVIPPKPQLEHRKEVGVYCRVSSNKPEQLESLAAQISELVRFVRLAGMYNLYDVYIDIMSGSETENRYGFLRMLEDCRRHAINLIVCKSISRFGRNTEEMLRSIREIKEHGVNVFFQLENINTLDSDTEHILTIIEAHREYEIKAKSESIRAGLEARAKTGSSGFYRRRCYGYQKGSDGELEIVPEEADVVRTIFDLYLKGASIGRIAAILTERGIKSPTGKDRWYNRTIDELLSNEKYIGDVVLVKSIAPRGKRGRRIKNDG
jgi:DNA invertase Pin-like site-specific DNA recombinase